MTWKQIRAVAEKQGLSCKQVYELVVAQKPTTNSAMVPLAELAKRFIGGTPNLSKQEQLAIGFFVAYVQQQHQ